MPLAAGLLCSPIIQWNIFNITVAWFQKGRSCIREFSYEEIKMGQISVSSDLVYFFFLIEWDWQLSPLDTSATDSPLYRPRMIKDKECGAIDGIRIGRGNRSTRREPASVPLCPPQIPHDLTRARTWAASVEIWRITAWTMARSSKSGFYAVVLKNVVPMQIEHMTAPISFCVFPRCIRLSFSHRLHIYVCWKVEM
jgi:hypothetical protein